MRVLPIAPGRTTRARASSMLRSESTSTSFLCASLMKAMPIEAMPVLWTGLPSTYRTAESAWSLACARGAISQREGRDGRGGARGEAGTGGEEQGGEGGARREGAGGARLSDVVLPAARLGVLDHLARHRQRGREVPADAVSPKHQRDELVVAERGAVLGHGEHAAEGDVQGRALLVLDKARVEADVVLLCAHGQTKA